MPRGAARCGENEFVWVDVTAPEEADFALLSERFGMHPLVMEDVRSEEGRPKLHEYDEQLYLIFHAVRKQNRDERFETNFVEIDCLIGPDYVLTLHLEPLPPFDDLRARWERHPGLMQPGPGYLLYELMDEVLDDYFPLLDAMDDHIDALEAQMLDGNGHNLTSEIFGLKRCLVEIRHIAGPMRDVVNTLMRRDAETGGRHFAYFQDLYDHAVRIVDMVDTFRDILSGAMDVYLASQSNRLNEVMKTMTAMSIMLLVPNLIAAIYGMNFKNMPELETRYGYFMALGVMAAVMAAIYANFKRKNWL
jgi:magnesium transporter